MPKVLFTASTFAHILHFHLPYLKAFRSMGWEVHTACGGSVSEIPFADRLVPLPIEKKMQSPENFRAAGKLRKLVQAEAYDLILTHTTLAAFVTRLAVKGLRNRPRLVNMVHGYLFDGATAFPKRTVLLAAEKLLRPETDLLLLMNECDMLLAERYRLAPRRVMVPGIGVDFSSMDPASLDREALRGEQGFTAEDFVLIYAAEFSPRKHQETLLRAMAVLPENTVLVLPGSGALLEDCRRLAEQLSLGRRVRFPGYIRNMDPWYALADAAVSSSRSEGLPFNIMEAMYAGLPVAATAVKGHTDLISEGETGLLFPFGDEAACAAQLQRMISSPALRERLSNNARQMVRQYGLDRVLPLVMEQYLSLVPTPEPVPV